MRIDAAHHAPPESRRARAHALRVARCMQPRARMGTAKQTKTLDVLELLTNQHTEVDALFDKLEKGKGNKAALFLELADKLAAHATVEEKIFYPAVMLEKTKDLLMESVEEHLEIKRTLADML